MGERTPLRHPWLLPAEFAMFAAIFWADAASWVPLSKTPLLLAVAWVSLRLRGQRWRDVGFFWPARGRRLLAAGIAAGIAFWAFEYYVENPLLHRWTHRYPDLTVFKDLVGNIGMLAVILALNLVLAAFGEELVWRGYALPRCAQLLGGSQGDWVLALIGINIAFGLAHLYQGTSGVVQAAFQGVLLGGLYLASGRNLLAPITAHFVANTCDFILIYLGVHVGLSP